MHEQQNSDNGIVNNIFISNLNINLNLNINISIPPSPMSTKGNGSRLESLHSEEDFKDHRKLKSKRSYYTKRQSSQIYQEDAHDSSVRNEDLSVIDDEMPISDKLAKNLKPSYV